MATGRKKGNRTGIAVLVLLLLLIGSIVFLVFKIISFINEEEPRPVITDVTTGTQTEPVITTTEPVTTETTEPTETSEDTPVTPAPVTYSKDFFKNSLFIGDSISTGFVNYGYLEAKNVFAVQGLNPESALTKEINGVTSIQKAKDLNPDIIYIMLGTNGMAYMGNSYMLNRMKELVSTLETAVPNSKICILSIPPVTKEHEIGNPENMTDINEYNSMLERYCKEEGIYFANIASVLKNDEGYFAEEYAEVDGLHFKGPAYVAVLHALEKQFS